MAKTLVVSFPDPTFTKVWRTSPEILGFLTWLVKSSHVIINIFTIVGGSGAEKTAGSGEVRCVAGTVPALLQSGVRRHFIKIIISP